VEVQGKVVPQVPVTKTPGLAVVPPFYTQEPQVQEVQAVAEPEQVRQFEAQAKQEPPLKN